MQTAYVTGKPTAVVVDGPFATCDRWGDEIPYWTVSFLDDEDCTVGKVYDCASYDRALALAERISKDRRLELVIDASPYA